MCWVAFGQGSATAGGAQVGGADRAGHACDDLVGGAEAGTEVVVTGRTQDGETSELDDDLAAHVHAVAQTVRETREAWQTRPSASNEAATRELLAYVTRDVAANR
ncbi:hypothetical protein [Streptomyces coerulescens]|uniref:Uncharacterized protein n=1 Tax=Streptomyces coerulescens TaxID=29304 RepID=A0ABW0CYB4_STRCD